MRGTVPPTHYPGPILASRQAQAHANRRRALVVGCHRVQVHVQHGEKIRLRCRDCLRRADPRRECDRTDEMPHRAQCNTSALEQLVRVSGPSRWRARIGRSTRFS
jgi:hypothetical protein